MSPGALRSAGTVPDMKDNITGDTVFRILSPFVYASALLYAGLVLPWRYLLHAHAELAAMAALAFLLLLALQRLRLGNAPHVTRRRSLIECGVALAALAALALPQARTVFPWLIMMVCLFPLILSGTWMAGVVAAIALTGLTLNLLATASASNLLSQLLATVFAGALAALLSKTLRRHLIAIDTSHINQARFNAIARITNNAVILADASLKVLYVSRAIKDIIGDTQNDVLRNGLPSAIHPDDLAAYEKSLRALQKLPKSITFIRYRMRHKNGRWVWLETYGYNMLHDSTINGFVFTLTNITGHKLAEQKLDNERILLRSVLDHNSSMIYATDPMGHFTFSNHGFQQYFGFLSEQDLHGKTIDELLLRQSSTSQANTARQLAHESQLYDARIMHSGEPVECLEIEDSQLNEVQRAIPRWYKYNKYPLRDSNGKIVGILNTMRDITQHKEYEIHLKYQALHDPLTGLANRRYMLQSIAENISSFHATGQTFTVVFCDLDFFKNVNDIHGHDFGDSCLREITQRINAQLDATDFAARFGSDEFVILIRASLADAAAKAQALLQALSAPLVINGIVVKVGASIGITQIRSDHNNSSDLIRDADAAMFQAKELGRNRIEIFNASLHDISTRRAQLDAALHFALENNEFSILYQPKVSMQDRSLKGLELLLRWSSARYGEVSPNEFIPIAESNGLIIPIGLWVLEQACKQQQYWQSTFPQASAVTVAVNVSMRQLLQTGFLPAATRILEDSGVIPDTIELELTETSVMARPLEVIENLTRLKRLGLRLALDDFGTGYSSLAYLQKLPINTLKIDKAFVIGIAKRKSDKEIVRLIIALAKTLALDIVAEGVETQEQVVALSRLGCDIGQGFLFSPPIGALEVERLLALQEDRRIEVAPKYIPVD